MKLPDLVLRANEERRVKGGHPWVFSNEVDVDKSPITEFSPGDWVTVRDHGGKALATAYVNPATLISARIVNREPDLPLSRDQMVERIRRALSLRERVFDVPYYRLVFGESDDLPGLVVDRHGEILVAQLNTAGMETLRMDIVSALEECLHPLALVLRNDVPARSMEGLEEYVETAIGELPDRVTIEENGVVFEIDPINGQKTGWFYDQRENRARLKRYVKGARVLDVFSYTGGFGIQAAVEGATSVHCIDSSEAALILALRNAALNRCGDRMTVDQADAFYALRKLRSEKQRFDLIILDPPAFARRKKDVRAALEAYARLNRLALQLLEDDGILFTSSCSWHVDAHQFMGALRAAARGANKRVQIIERGHQAPDHPVHPALEETDYLKFTVARATEGL
ncbi:MAG: class I SAM-dependent rRNA methyltransferase [Gammaproteobacteria bacterium]|nr:class I SAM-dependent rRNA methyltransferase [Gammaproteobacteria bacterium]